MRAIRPIIQRDNGFSLLELLVVLAILGIALSFVTPRLRFSDRLQLESFAQRCAGELRLTRSAAIGSNRQMIVTIDTQNRRFVSSARPGSLAIPPEISVSLSAAALRSSETAAVAFFPDGSSSGGTIDMKRGNQNMAIRINWLTGAVDLDPRS